MKTAVVSFYPVRTGRIVADTRLAAWLAWRHKADLLDSPALFGTKTKYDLLIVINGLLAFCNYREAVIKFLKAHKGQFLIVLNDYTVPIHTHIMFLLERDVRVTGAFENFRSYPNYIRFNWNRIGFKPVMNLVPWEKRIGGLMYYGAFRQGRLQAFERYIQFASRLYPIHISTAARNEKKFLAMNPDVRFFKIKNIFLDVQRYRSTIYLQDKRNDVKLPVYPANRFYECLSARVFQVFDARCQSNFADAGIDIGPWLVENSVHASKLIDSRSLWYLQMQILYKDYRAELTKDHQRVFLDKWNTMGEPGPDDFQPTARHLHPD